MQALANAVTCDRVRPQIANAISKLEADAARRAAAMPNSPELVRAAQLQLTRIGCVPGKPDGMLGANTKAALDRYMAVKGEAGDVTVTEALVASLTNESGRVCPLECNTDETLKGDTCVANEKPAAPVVSRRQNDDDDAPARRKPARAKRQAEREQRRGSSSRPAPRARQEAVARPSGGGSTMIGVGF